MIGGPGETISADRGFEVDWLGRPVIPASSFRGRVRATLESLAAPLGWEVCNPPSPAGLCRPDLSLPDPFPHMCIGCRIFGNPWAPSSIVCSDLTATALSQLKGDTSRITSEVPSLIRTHVGISRHLGTAAEGRLYSVAIPDRVVEDDELCYVGRLSGELSEEDLGMLLAAIKSVRSIGGGKNRGLGAVKVEITSMQVEGEPLFSGNEAQEKAMTLVEMTLMGRCES